MRYPVGTMSTDARESDARKRLDELISKMVHDVNQPLSGIVTNANTCLRMLGADPPNVAGAQETARRTIRDAGRVSELIAEFRTIYASATWTAGPSRS